MSQTHILFSLLMAIMTLNTQAADDHKAQKANDNAGAPVITVNKATLSQATYVDALRAQLASGAKDSQQLRQLVLDDLILTEALAQESVKSKLNTEPEIKRAIESAQRKILAEAYMISQLRKSPVTDNDARNEYDRQIGMTKEGRNSVEYKTSQIVVKDEATAKVVLDRLKAGEDFVKVAKETSLDKEVSQHGGALPWSLPDQFIQPLGDVVVNLSKGQLVNAPVQSAMGWHIIKLEDTQAFSAPSFEDSKERMKQTLLERRKQEIIQNVMKKTEVKGQ